MSFSQLVTDVTRPEQMADVAKRLDAVTEFSVDVEADSMHHFNARLCFVQLGTEEDIFLVDTLAPGVGLDALKAKFEDPNVTKYFHASQGDLQYLAESGVRVRGLFDTHRAVTLLGWPKVGLADLVKEKLGQVLKKEHQQADFSIRPLPPELREYIADDVRYLNEVGRWVRQACVDAGILEEVLLDCERLCDDAAARPDPAEDFEPKIQRQGMSKEQVVLAWHLSVALNRKRLEWAAKDDVPMGRMLSNMALQAIAAKPPADAKTLGKLAGVRGPFVREHGDEVLSIIAELQKQQAEGTLALPDENRQRDPKKKKREDVLVEWRKKEAAERKITPSAVLSNGLVASLASQPPETLVELAKVPYFGGKRLERYGATVLELLSPFR